MDSSNPHEPKFTSQNFKYLESHNVSSLSINNFQSEYCFFRNSSQENHCKNIGPNVNLKRNNKIRFYTCKEKFEFNLKIEVNSKTELCKNWLLYNDCYFKDNCSFAHGEQELRIRRVNQESKNQNCLDFHKKGYCNYGIRCIFSHFIERKNNLISFKHSLSQLSFGIQIQLKRLKIDNCKLEDALNFVKLRNRYIYERLQVFRNIAGDK